MRYIYEGLRDFPVVSRDMPTLWLVPGIGVLAVVATAFT